MRNVNGEALRALDSQYEQLVKSKFIFCSAPMKNFLKCLAYYDEFSAVIKKYKQNFDYKKEFYKCAMDINGVKTFTLPTIHSKIIPLVTCLLLDFDDGTKNFTEFMLDYFPSASHNQSYYAFCDAVITPFYEAIKAVAFGGEVRLQEDEITVADKQITIVNGGLFEQSEYLTQRLYEAVKTSNLTDEEREECKLVIEGFLLATESCDSRRIRSAWIGMKNTLKIVKAITTQLTKIEDLLKFYLVL